MDEVVCSMFVFIYLRSERKKKSKKYENKELRYAIHTGTHRWHEWIDEDEKKNTIAKQTSVL